MAHLGIGWRDIAWLPSVGGNKTRSVSDWRGSCRSETGATAMSSESCRAPGAIHISFRGGRCGMTRRFSVGHPIDVVTGVLFHEMTDRVLLGRVRVPFTRRYSTAMLPLEGGMLGSGW